MEGIIAALRASMRMLARREMSCLRSNQLSYNAGIGVFTAHVYGGDDLQIQLMATAAFTPNLDVIREQAVGKARGVARRHVLALLPGGPGVGLLQFVDGPVECVGVIATFDPDFVEWLEIDIGDILAGDDQQRLRPQAFATDIQRGGGVGMQGAAAGYLDRRGPRVVQNHIADGAVGLGEKILKNAVIKDDVVQVLRVREDVRAHQFRSLLLSRSSMNR